MSLCHTLARRLLPGAVALAYLLPAPAQAGENPACADISLGAPVIYGAGGSAQRDLIGKAAFVMQAGTDPVYVVYKDDAGACSGINALTGLAGYTISGTAYYWDETGARKTCDLSLSGDTVDFASMIVNPDQCPLVTDPSLVENIVQVEVPISAISVIVDARSTVQSISAEAFYLVYGFGPEAGIEPWVNPDPEYVLKRDENSAAGIIMSLATGLDITKFYGTDAGSNSNSVAWLIDNADPEAGIAFCSADVADANRATVRALAWQDTGQNVGYWPDSTATSFDKKNVRNGQYELWMPGYLFALEGSAEGSYADSDTQVLLEYLSGTAQPAGTSKSVTDVAIENKNVPACAMHVTRTDDLGPLIASEPDEACDCYFAFKTTGATTCDVCDDATPCSTGTCRNGFCEAN